MNQQLQDGKYNQEEVSKLKNEIKSQKQHNLELADALEQLNKNLLEKESDFVIIAEELVRLEEQNKVLKIEVERGGKDSEQYKQ